MLVEELALKTWTIDSVTEGKVECEVHLQVVDRIGGEDVLDHFYCFYSRNKQSHQCSYEGRKRCSRFKERDLK